MLMRVKNERDLNEPDTIRINMKKSSGQFISDNTFFDNLLVMTGKAPNIENLQLEKAGVNHSLHDGIFVD